MGDLGDMILVTVTKSMKGSYVSAAFIVHFQCTLFEPRACHKISSVIRDEYLIRLTKIIFLCCTFFCFKIVNCNCFYTLVRACVVIISVLITFWNENSLKKIRLKDFSTQLKLKVNFEIKRCATVHETPIHNA